MNEPNVEINFGGLKCDSCDWKDETITMESYSKWLNKPCPQCGANVLTEDDFKRCEALLAAAHIVNMLPYEELEAANESPEIILERLKANPLMKDIAGLDKLLTMNPNDRVIISMDTHNEIKVSEIKFPDTNTPNP